MSFGTQLREYREEYLKITQKQMAEDLGVNAATISRYESDQREFPVEQLPLMKKLYNISDEVFLAIILDRPLKTVLSFKDMYTLDHTSNYANSFLPQYADLIENEPDLKGLIATLARLEDEERKMLLSGIRSILHALQN
ncbi:helix-turn-helix transcriptional regulator [Sporosarcina sp.]|uniref:helix-turn-helix domain-containing protein n=1 Tax=Sporosarcina sp. TaxID=49982 RepID=UPI00261488FB|nr:helix-turn-helix transcriptional regulator [Sporosarcina sp.]